jgi:hypothetical protein
MAGPIGDIVAGIVGLVVVKKGVDTITHAETSQDDPPAESGSDD